MGDAIWIDKSGHSMQAVVVTDGAGPAACPRFLLSSVRTGSAARGVCN